MRVKTICALLLLTLVTNATSTQAIQTAIDAGSIVHWQEGWAPRPIHMNVANEGDSATLTFYYRTTVAIPSGSVIQVYFPSNINSGTTMEGDIDSDMNAGDETYLELTAFSLPSSAGAYGPIGITIRSSTNGQILAMTNAFGCIYVKPNEATPSSGFVVTRVGTTDAASPNSAVNIGFQFPLTTDVWPHDVFAITANNAGWTLGNPSCSSYVAANTANHYVSGDNSSLSCVANGRTVYIYGVSTEIDVHVVQTSGSLQSEFRVTGYTTPKYKTSTSNNGWTMSHWRGYSNYKITTWTANGISTNPGALTITDWNPHSGYSRTAVKTGMIMYMNITVGTNYALTNGGTITLTFTNADVQTASYDGFDGEQANGSVNDYVYLHYDSTITGVTVDVTSTTTVVITAASTLPDNTSLTLSLLTTFSGAANATATVTGVSNDGTYEVDNTTQVSSIPDIAYAGDDTVLECAYFNLYFAADQSEGTTQNGLQAAGDNANKFIHFAFNTKATPGLTTAAIKIRIPGSISGINDFGLQFANLMEADSVLVNSALSTTATDVTPTTGGVTVTPGANSFTFNLDLTGKQAGTVSVYNASAADTPTTMSLPRVASNKYTRYEAYIEITESTKITYAGFKQFSITIPAFTTATFTSLCQNVKAIELQPSFNTNTASGNTYYVDIDFNAAYSAGLGSGITTTGSAYPVTGDGVTVTGVLSASKTLRLEGISSWQNGTTHRVFTAVETLGSSDSADITLYFRLDTDPTEKQIVNKNIGATPAAITGIGGITLDGTAVNLTNATTTVAINSTPSFASPSSGSFTNTSGLDNYSMQFPKGYNVSGATLTLADATGAAGTLNNGTQLVLGANNYDFEFPAVIAYQASCPDTGCEMTVSGVTAPRASKTTHAIKFGVDLNSECKQDNDVVVVAGAITVTEPTGTINIRGADNINKTLNFSLKGANAVPVDGVLNFTLGSDWKVCPNSTCTLTGGATGSCTPGTNFVFTSAYTANAAINVEITNLLAPATAATAHQFLGSATTTFGTTVDNYTYSSANDAVAITTTTNTLGQTASDDLEIRTIPPNASLTSADLYFRFKLTKNVPKSGKIHITPSIPFTARTTNPENYVFFSKRYSAVTLASNSLVITLDEAVATSDVLELYLEDAFDTPSATPGTPGFRVKADYTCDSTTITLTDDAGTGITAATGLNIALTAAATSLTSSTGISFEPVNAGEMASYTFTFTTAGAVESTDEFWIKFPRAYDEVVGSGNWPSNIRFERYRTGSANYFFLECASSELGSNVECTAQHRIVRVFNPSAITTGQQIVLTISYVQNPGAGATGEFKIYHVDSDGNVKSELENLTGVTIAAPTASNITIKDITHDSYMMNTSTSYTLQLVFDSTFSVTTNSSISLLLPRQYNTNLSRGNSTGQTTPCSMVYFDTDDTTADNDNATNTGTAITGISSCSVSNNEISANFDSTLTDSVLSGAFRLDWQIDNLNNPNWAHQWNDQLDRTTLYDQWDTGLFEARHEWTHQLMVAMFNDSTNTIESMSYTNVNEAWLGFDATFRGFTFNNYDPEDFTGYVYVVAGTQTESLMLSTVNGNLAAEKIVFDASLNSYHRSSGTLQFSSVYHNKTMFANESSIYWRVSASGDSDQGIYYINWTATYTQFDGVSTNQYQVPNRTMVEVNNAKATCTVSPNTNVAVEVGRTSIPIRVHCPNAPYDSLDVGIALNDANLGNKVTLSMSSLNFIPDRNSRYFTITVSNDFDTATDATALSVVFTLSGTNAASYNAISSLSFTVQASTNASETVSVPTLTFSDPDFTSVNLSVTTSVNPGIIYWYCAAQGSTGKTGTELRSELSNYFKLTEQQTTTDYSAREDLEVKPASSDTSSYTDTWSMYEYRLYRNHITNYSQSGAYPSTVTTSQQVGMLHNLAGETTYQCWVYVEDKYTNLSTVATGTVTTDSLPLAARFTLTFTNTAATENTPEVKVAESNQTDFEGYIAEVFGVQPQRLINFTFTDNATSGNTIGTTVFTWDVPALRLFESPSPSQQMGLNTGTQDLLGTRIKSKVQNTYSAATTDIARQSAHNWATNGTPTQNGQSTVNSVVLQATCTANGGYICGACVTTGNSLSATHNQILVGLNENNQATAGYSCTSFTGNDSATQVTVSGLTAETSYKCYMQCFNDYPVWPGYISYSAENPIASVNVTTAADEDDDDDFAQYIGAFVALVFALLFQLGQFQTY